MSKEFTKNDLDNHLKESHNKTFFSDYLKEIVFGGVDGIVTTFAITAGFAGSAITSESSGAVVLPIAAVLIFGFANLLADGFSMGVGEFLSARAEKKNYEKEFLKEKESIVDELDFEIKETIFLLKEKGFNDEDAKKLVEIFQKNHKYWAEFMVNYEIGIFDYDGSPLKQAFATISSFIFFGFIPLISYVFSFEENQFLFSIFFSFIALIILSILRALVTKEPYFKSIFETLILGILAGAIAFGVGFVLS